MRSCGMQGCCERCDAVAHVPYAQIIIFPATYKTRNWSFVCHLTEPRHACYTSWVGVLVSCDERAGGPEVYVSVRHASDDECWRGAEGDAQRTLKHSVASKNALAACSSQDVTAFNHFVPNSPKFAGTVVSTEGIELDREHVCRLQAHVNQHV